MNSKGIDLNIKFIPIILLLTIIGSALPDIIEPSRNKFHRKFFHSVLMLTIIFVFLIMTYKEHIMSGNFDNPILACYFFVGCGYASHLLVDSTSRNGLPLTGL
jgi:inner membrane protein